MKQIEILKGYSLPYNELNTEFIPQHTENIVGEEEKIKVLIQAVEHNLPVLMIGHTGVGKTSIIRHLAVKTNNAFRRLNLNGNTTVDEFVGKMVPEEGGQGWKWVDGVLIDAMRKGHWLLLDEINAALPEILFALHSLLDDDHYVVVPEYKGEIVHPHPNFRIFAAMNPSHSYAGTKELNKAFLSRFPIVMQFRPLEKDQEREILKTRFPDVKLKHVEQLVEIMDAVRSTFLEEKTEFYISTRDSIACLNLYEMEYKKDPTTYDAKEKADNLIFRNAIVLSILNKAPQEEQESLKHVLQTYLGNMFDSNAEPAKRLDIDYQEAMTHLTYAGNTIMHLYKYMDKELTDKSEVSILVRQSTKEDTKKAADLLLSVANVIHKTYVR